ncbi:mannitol dehydrogenase family protein [Curvibacter sp. HBC28]|uniref:Mannitol dehydrogenase family protein n=1 Tax=Curvibacter microcysteis TaxID=3026419 RepID=A0ABT5MAM7_9BURK|nr:mannitol dehydrogenase family protein [Curvibacter sp. HBC28]MDD0813445.1 mannitol dehydrogenase family protein [Curvibacter sp. HBC28]
MPSLNRHTLNQLPERGVRVPGADRHRLTPGVLHLGLGAFHRAHQALVFDHLLQAGHRHWGVHGVAMRSTTLADALARQDGLYAVQIASQQGLHWQVPGALLRTSVAAREPEAVLQAIAAPGTRWITLTVTEKGYTPELAALLRQGLARRQQAGLPGLTLASCDNLSDNGRRLQALCTAEPGALSDWIAQRCAFPNSMVDRIVPAATPERLQAARQALGLDDEAALGTEAFWEWVIERRFVDPADGPALASAGVTVVDDVRPFEEAKLRLLNGSHSAMACMGAVMGLAVIADCIGTPAIRQFVHSLMSTEVAPHLSRRDWADYRDALLARFGNPELKHSVHQIATDSSQKIPLRWPPSAERQLAAGQGISHLAFSAAVYLRYLLGVNEQGQPYTLNDPQAEALQALARAHAGDAAATVRALSARLDLWGPTLPHHPRWTGAVQHHLERIQALGVLGALNELHAATAPSGTP